MDPILGIDLGTSNSLIGIWRNNNIELIPDDKGNYLVPSVVSFTSKNRYIGIEALNQVDLMPANVFSEVKRLIGRKYLETLDDLEYCGYQVEEQEKNMIMVTSWGKRLTPEMVSAMILTKLKTMATEYLKIDVKKVVITVPAYFNDSQRQATKDAAEIAGLECIRILNEPTAAALAYGILNRSQESRNIIVYDLGGSTCDVTLLNITDGLFEVLGSVGNTRLGGMDFNNKLIKHCITSFEKKYNYSNIDINPFSLQKLRKSCETAKKVLSTVNKTIIAISDFYDGKDLCINLSRSQFNQICKDLIILCMKPLFDILKSCNKKKEEIDEIILVGGMTRTPVIRDNIKQFLGREPNISVNPDEVVCVGAAIQGYILSNKTDPFSENITLLDTVPLSLGVETIGGVMDVLINRNTVVPVTKKRLYTTDTDNVDSVMIRVFEGERKMTKDNFFVGEFELSGIEKEIRGMPEIEVSFKVDINNIITVSAKYLETKTEILITGNKGRLSKDELDILIKEAQEFELKDKLERIKKQLYYEIEDMCSNILINIKDEECKYTTTDKEIIEKEVTDLLTDLKSKKYYQREETEYNNIIERVKSRYSTLILKMKTSVHNPDIKSKNNNTGTNLFDDDDITDDILNEALNKADIEEFGENQNIREIKELKTKLVELCNSLHNILQVDNCLLEEKDKLELRDYIDDTLLWIYSINKPTKLDYETKIEEVNKVSDDIYNDYVKNNKNIFYEKTPKDELFELSRSLLQSIENGSFSSLDEKHINIIKENINSINNEDTNNDEYYINKYNELNQLCIDVYNSLSIME